MNTLVTIIHVFSCVLLVLTVLLQSGKGAEVSASLSGSSQTVFGSSGGANFFSRLTAVLAAIFMITSLGLTVINSNAKKSVFETGSLPTLPASTAPVSAPAAPAAPADQKTDAAKPAEQKAPETAKKPQ